MFTGIVEEMGGITVMNKSLAGAKLTILASTVMSDLKIGDSVSVNGICLTVVSRSERDFSVEVSPETLSVTTLGSFAVGMPVNLERAMKLNERIGGHLVAGHVDGVGMIRSRQQDANTIVFTIGAPPEILRYCVAKGSITVDGISLTIAALGQDRIALQIIPFTFAHTSLAQAEVGDPVNLEADVLGKYVIRLLEHQFAAVAAGATPPHPS